ncbi:MAG TPA: energy transducer TonB [Longimicrobium sp.]|nr:energy transducer TonB [Longimicrobium sp.]
MFNKLVASEGRKKSFWSPTTIIVSIVLHGALVAGAWAANLNAEGGKKKNEELVDFMEVEEDKPKEPEPEKPKEPEPPPPEPEEAPPPVAKGFQELIPPEEPPPVIAPPSATEQEVKVEDFSGVGKSGGVAEGVETGVQQSTVERTAPPDEGTYELSAVEEMPRVTNAAEFGRALERNYPPLARDAGLEATVTVRFRVLEDGRVDPESISIVDSTSEQFNEPTRRAVTRLRFRPAKVGNQPVKVWVDQPVRWTLAR